MSYSADLLKTADLLVKHTTKRPRQSDLKRAVSTCYYAMFHALARLCADALVGSPSPGRTERAWRQVYRSVEHGNAAKRCTTLFRHGAGRGFPRAVVDFAEQFEPTMGERHGADYDPAYKATKEDVSKLVATTRSVITDLDDLDARDKRAFAVFVLFRER